MTKAAPTTVGRQAATAVLAVFCLNGFLFANWVSRLPAVRDALGLRPGEMGLVLLIGSFGSLLAMPATGVVVQRLGTRTTVRVAATTSMAGFIVVGAGLQLTLVPLLMVGLFIAMTGIGAWDVAMNLEGGLVEHEISRPIMPRFHAAFSLGTVAGAGIGALAASLGLSVTWHLAVILIITITGTLISVGRFLPTEPAPTTSGQGPRQRVAAALGGWREARTVLLGVMVLAFALTEGAANDWLALGVVDGFNAPDSVGALGFGCFVAAMTIMRLAGERLLERYGRLPVLRLSTILALIGLLLFGLSPWLPLAFLGALAWGLGAALGFPVGMSAAGDEPLKAAQRVSVVSSVGYMAFLTGPPLLGLLADYVGYRHAMLAIALPLAAGFLLAPVARSRKTR